MEKIKHLPRCYNFSFDHEKLELLVGIQKATIPIIKTSLTTDSPLMMSLYQNYGGDKNLFINFGEKDKSFGYNNSIVYKEETEDEIVYSYILTPAFEVTKKTCEYCDGTGINNINGFSCFSCRGKGKKLIESERQFDQALISLFPIIWLENYIISDELQDKENISLGLKLNYSKKQTVALSWSSSTGMNNCFMGGWLDKEIFEWGKTLTKEQSHIINEAMRKTHETLFLSKKEIYDYRLHYFDERLFSIDIPGNACCVYGPAEGTMEMFFTNLGTTLSCHNVDGRFQQILFIVGLSVFNDLFDLDKNK
jgi:hypothetical protein